MHIHPLTPDRWIDLEDLFGPERGANSGCWCLWPRVPGTVFRNMDREARKAAFRELVRQGPPPGLLAYADDGIAVGWCAVGPRPTFARFESAKTSRLAPDVSGPTTDTIYAITCFYVRNGHRRAGLTRILVQAAIEHARAQGAAAVDVCAIDTERPLVWGEGFVGIASTFRALGFREIARRSPNRPLMRLDLDPA